MTAKEAPLAAIDIRGAKVVINLSRFQFRTAQLVTQCNQPRSSLGKVRKLIWL